MSSLPYDAKENQEFPGRGEAPASVNYSARLSSPLAGPAESEFTTSLSARFPSTLRQDALPREMAVLAYHFWETRGCPRASPEDDTDVYR